jgi:exopolysaccharide biosynthesis polyprenyl glycosylphosphotransferase
MLHGWSGRGKLLLADEVWIVVSGLAGLLLDRGLRGLPDPPVSLRSLATVALLLAIWLAALYVSGAYERQYLRLPRRSLYLTLCAVVIAYLTSAVLFLVFPSLRLSGAAYLASTILTACGLVANRRIWLLRHGSDPPRRLIGLGDPSFLQRVWEDMRKAGGLDGRWEFVQLPTPDGAAQAATGALMREAVQLLDQHPRSAVVVTDGQVRSNEATQVLTYASLRGASVMDVFSFYEAATGRCFVVRFDGQWLHRPSRATPTEATIAFKRALDLLLCLAAAPLAVPLLLLGALAIRLESPGPVIHAQRRIGWRGEEFTLYKLRTMEVDAEAATGPIWATADDPRITRVGRILRHTGLDELPQLWNVLRGDMSIIGPRPERSEIAAMLAQELPLYMQRHIVPPGITGWAQLHRGADLTPEDALDKLRYDLYYVDRVSLRLDVEILLRTIQMTFASAKPSTGARSVT